MHTVFHQNLISNSLSLLDGILQKKILSYATCRFPLNPSANLSSLSPPMSCNKKKLLKNIFTPNAGCGSCGKPKLSDVIQPQPKPKTKLPPNHQNPTTLYPCSSSSWEKTCDNPSISMDDDQEDHTTSSTTSFSFNNTTDTSPEPGGPHCSRMASPCPKIRDSVAVVKDSDDPYRDFRRSMLQMILGREIYSREDLQELLSCFLQLNSPDHHDVIVRAFTEIWNGVISSKSPPEPPPSQ